MSNPFFTFILQYLSAHPGGVSEYQLLKHCEQTGLFDHVTSRGDLQLFHKHFLLMNALYQLQHRLWQEEHLWLTISALQIQLQSAAQRYSTTHEPAAQAHGPLAEYYLDWTNYQDADEQSVAQLLADFWQQFYHPHARDQALAQLHIEPGTATPALIRRQYQRLALRHHPDRGGNPERFIAIRQAYELLR